MLSEALNYLGSALDKPGRAVRGLLSGNLREGLAAVPFSDSMGLTDEHQRVSGRDLTDKWGVTRKGDKGWGSWGAGLGTEIALDPLNFIPAHSVFKALKPGDAAAHGLTAGKAAAQPDVRGMMNAHFGLKFDGRMSGLPGARANPDYINKWEQVNASLGRGGTHPGLGGDSLRPGSLGDHLRGGVQGDVPAGGVSGQGLSQRLRPLREGIPVFKFGGEKERIVGRGDWASGKLMNAASDLMQLKKEFPQLGGVSISPWAEKIMPSAGTAASWAPEATREELLHAMTSRAAHSGNISDLPMLARPAAHAYRLAHKTESKTLHGIGSILDELSAKAMAERSPAGKLGAAMNFLLDPQAHQLYDQQFAAHGFIPRAAYHTLPYAVPASAAAAAGYALSGNR